MHDTGKVIIGLVVFLALIAAPVWYNMESGQAGNIPVLERPQGEVQCVRDSSFMSVHHMDLLNQWRDDVVRRGDRFEVSADGHRYEKSLTNTCLGCHKSKEKFCDRCHTYLSVDPYCWDCHVVPEEQRL